MKWSELSYTNKNYHIPFDDNQKAVRGFFLWKLGIDLENIPNIFNEQHQYHKKKIETENNNNKKYYERFISQKVFLDDIVGTSSETYGGMEIIQSFMKIKRADFYIKEGYVTRNKYFHMLKKPTSQQENRIILSRLDNGNYFVDGNGNHRVVLYKIMMFAEIVVAHNNYFYTDGRFIYDDEEDFIELSECKINNIKKKYWLNAFINP